MRAADVMASKAVVDGYAAWNRRWCRRPVLLRPSGTEPLIRVMVEGREAAVVTSNANAIAEAVRHPVAA